MITWWFCAYLTFKFQFLASLFDVADGRKSINESGGPNVGTRRISRVPKVLMQVDEMPALTEEEAMEAGRDPYGGFVVVG